MKKTAFGRVAFLLLTIAPIIAVLPAPLHAQAARDSVAEGTWEGPFGEHTWTFKFEQRNGSWSGQYMSGKYRKWHALRNFAVSGRLITFQIQSDPLLAFTLKVEEGDMLLSGGAALPDGSFIRQTARRVS